MIVYFIENRDGLQYIGLTRDLESRLARHRKGRVASTNKGDLEWELIWTWEAPSYVLGSKLERFLHIWQGRLKRDLVDFVCDHQVWDQRIEKLVSPLKTTEFEKRQVG